MEAEEFLRFAAETLRKARELPVGPERNELRQVGSSRPQMDGKTEFVVRNLSELRCKMIVHSNPSLIPIERPRCTRCQTPMMLARREPHLNGSEKRTFECPKCNFIETKIADDPLKSDAVVRLADSLRPPS